MEVPVDIVPVDVLAKALCGEGAGVPAEEAVWTKPCGRRATKRAGSMLLFDACVCWQLNCDREHSRKMKGHQRRSYGIRS